MKRIVLALLLTLAFGLLYHLSVHSRPSVVGVWKGVDEYGHEHYFEFHKDGTLTWWDRDRSHDGTFKDRPCFCGSYRYAGRKTIKATDIGFPAQPLGTMTLLSENELKQDGGHPMRHNLVYRRVRGD